MIPLQEIKSKANQIKQLIAADKRSEIKLNANGGNSILLVCPPEQEIEFINEFNETLSSEEFEIIDVNKLLNEYISKHKDDINMKFDLIRESLDQIFKLPDEEEGEDFFKYLMGIIKTVIDKNKIPVLVSVGTLYGTGIDNIHIMENKTVMEAKLPLVILYPATRNKDRLMFLNTRSASKYRCMIVE